MPKSSDAVNRRSFLQAGAAAGLTGLAVANLPQPAAAAQPAQQAQERKPATFQIACMTLAYSAFPLQRALQGLRNAGYRHIAWGTTHLEGGKRVPVMPLDAPPKQARELAQRCRDMGLETLMMFSGLNPGGKEAVKNMTRRIEQAAAAGIPHLLTFGSTRGDDIKVWVQNLRQLGPIARKNNVLIVIKQHGGNTGTGRACGEIVREVNDAGVRVNYDSGNVMDYHNFPPAKIYADLESCADVTHSFCIKDHRDWPRDQDCGPGFGEIDHYRLLNLVAFSGRTIPLCCENIFAPIVPRPQKPEGVDALARRAREFLEVVTQGLLLAGQPKK